MSGERITIEPEPTPEEQEAIRRALETLGLVEPDRPGRPPEPERGQAPHPPA
ncbi:MAG TPA: hypothetical protein VE777_07980 [Gaiellales bacterium]|nr:hypothetical protein [Gaiellales bacterium]